MRYYGNISCKNEHNKGEKWRTSQKQKRLRRGRKNTQKNYTKNVLMTQITTMVLTQITPRARHLECEFKWALGSITTNKARGGNRIPAELFKILKVAH